MFCHIFYILYFPEGQRWENKLLNRCYVRFGKNKHSSTSGTSWSSGETLTEAYVKLIAGCISQ